ncbi:MAG: hypothetical protein HY598_05155 [Candidatus Omnitrophica bacterium]|nr:hypothetical protein [Candidatus Omnitrophota bacterium]
MNRLACGVIVMTLLVSPCGAWSEEGHEHGDHDHGTHAMPTASGAGVTGEQTLTGEVTDVFCYLSHPQEGLGPTHAGCAKKCINSGLPVAIKVGERLYLATMADHNPANQQLASLAGQQVTVRGNVLERDGQWLIAISSVEPAH